VAPLEGASVWLAPTGWLGFYLKPQAQPTALWAGLPGVRGCVVHTEEDAQPRTPTPAPAFQLGLRPAEGRLPFGWARGPSEARGGEKCRASPYFG